MKVFDKKNLVKVAKRDNNSLRQYLLVNPLQGKHIPAKPSDCFDLFSRLKNILAGKLEGEKLLLIGFAETATAIGAYLSVSCENVSYYIHTTRECVSDADEYLYFSEVHSHAAEQKIVADNLRQYIMQTDRIVFVEDEVTTGNTISNLISVLNERFCELGNLKFGVISILNSMNEERLKIFHENDIEVLYLLKLGKIDFDYVLSKFEFEESLNVQPKASKFFGNETILNGKLDPRIGVVPMEYLRACRELAEDCINCIGNTSGKKVLVLGTEEFMFPPMFLAGEIEKRYNSEVYFHATTRSPILPSVSEGYPLKSRCFLESVYEEGRNTFLYNIESYDVVVWLFDAENKNRNGIQLLKGALEEAECGNIYFFEWGD